METRKIWGAALICVGITAAGGVLAQGGAQPADQKHTPAAKYRSADSTSHMGSMHEGMKTMHEQMERIHSATDPEERQRLIDEHMKSMHEGMSMTHGMMGGAESGARNEGGGSNHMRMHGGEMRK